MSLRIFNTLSRAVSDFSPAEPGHVRMYVCGMTVYDLCHLGHARSMIAFDVVQRWLKASGYQVTYVRNVTDIDDSLLWYRGMGFLDVAEHVLDNGDFVGLKTADGSPAIGRVRRMKLPDEAAEIVLTDWTNPKSHGQHPADANHAGLFRTAVGVDDTVESYERFLAEGWKFEREPRQVELEGTAVPDMWICFLNDPDGVPFEFVQRPRSAFRPERT
mgnify:CR=1 FL=1